MLSEKKIFVTNLHFLTDSQFFVDSPLKSNNPYFLLKKRSVCENKTESNKENPLAPRMYDIVPSLSWWKKHLILDHSCFSLFTQKTWGFISEIGRLGPILDLKPISLFSFFTAVEIVYVTIGNPAFCLVLYLTDVTFRGELQHVGHVGGQKIKCRPIRTRQRGGVRLQGELYA